MDLPTEIILCIADSLSPRDLSSLSQTCRFSHNVLDSVLWNNNANTALLWAADKGNQRAARKALGFHADINTRDPTDAVLPHFRFWSHEKKKYKRTGLTPLALAIIAGRQEMVDFLLSVAGVDVNARDNPERFTPLTLAIVTDHHDIMQRLLAVDAINPELRDRFSAGSALMVAVHLHRIELVKTLLAHPKIHPDRGNLISQSPLWLAVHQKNLELVKLFLEAGASPHPPLPDPHNEYGWYAEPLDSAVSNNTPAIVRALVTSPLFDVSRVSHDHRIERFECKALWHNRVDLFEALFATLGCEEVNWAHGDGRTCLWWAAAHGQTDVVRTLLSLQGVDVNTRGIGVTYTHEYVERERVLGPPGYGEGVTPLIVATRGGHLEVVRLLLQAGADVSIRDAEGETALQAAEFEEIAQLLINA
ncbi:hypothetical protein ASPZODRAFT_136371 [Penicilliopsis zonata CBS 506.65]|uniref:F-box domain-containing protein n=1 Tax=Penicilliopsis zonata CBS 506.65 TaxID=1073090 RepID=A0A1L9S7Q0_9EURO|nr:hypothetical protein ASPZODRAFT_136371 [Penicilliopsis zonata CBS 506.65]OJJ43186.1 hypothetical protein ASPZODRAFT_136371 [Penicilliopsis zonata CBS 506.65]